ncbi:MAG TPA: outer membrane protein assembly factor BamD [Gammaproteobacteria bacterium]|nr:outer membrane protein assembly factor BamD [Gammaproteobacteria bacterium]
MGRTLLYLLLGATLLSGCASTEEKDKTANWSAERIYSEASAGLNEGNYDKAIKNYELLEARYPYGQYAAQAQLEIAYAYSHYDEPDAAIDALDRFIRLHPDHPEVAYAYYMKGIVNLERNLGLMDRFVPTDASQRDPVSYAQAYKDFKEVVERFPDTKYAKDAQQRAVYLFNSLAMHEIHIANYYMDRGAYLAAVKRAVGVVENYQRTPAAEKALLIMVDAYTKLDLPEFAADANRVLVLNREQGKFGSDAYEEANRSLLKRFWDYVGLDEG